VGRVRQVQAERPALAAVVLEGRADLETAQLARPTGVAVVAVQQETLAAVRVRRARAGLAW
jgi:hypothetical protein